MPEALTPGATYRFVVRSAEEAVQTIRDRLGPNAKVLSVRQVSGGGLSGLFSKPQLEVVAQVAEEEAGPSEAPLPSLEEAAAPAKIAAQAQKQSAGSSGVGTAENLYRAAMPAVETTASKLPELLKRSGFSENTLRRLHDTDAFKRALEQPLHHGLVEVAQHLRRQAALRKPRPLPSRTAFLGTPGVGRTTALCKWLAREVFQRERAGRVIKAEFDRPNPGEGLGVFCEALGLTMEHYIPEAEDVPSTLDGPPAEFLYADLPGLSLRSPGENASLTRFLEREKFAGRVLVLNAAYDVSNLRRAYAVGSDLGATHVVFTHLDEQDHWGKLWDLLLDGELTPLFLATGPSLTGDCEDDPLGAVLRKTIPGA